MISWLRHVRHYFEIYTVGNMNLWAIARASLHLLLLAWKSSTSWKTCSGVLLQPRARLYQGFILSLRLAIPLKMLWISFTRSPNCCECGPTTWQALLITSAHSSLWQTGRAATSMVWAITKLETTTAQNTISKNKQTRKQKYRRAETHFSGVLITHLCHASPEPLNLRVIWGESRV